MGALYGPLHGGANEAVLRMLERIGSVDRIAGFIEGVKARKEKMFGFGHRCARLVCLAMGVGARGLSARTCTVRRSGARPCARGTCKGLPALASGRLVGQWRCWAGMHHMWLGQAHPGSNMRRGASFDRISFHFCVTGWSMKRTAWMSTPDNTVVAH